MVREEGAESFHQFRYAKSMFKLNSACPRLIPEECALVTPCFVPGYSLASFLWTRELHAIPTVLHTHDLVSKQSKLCVFLPVLYPIRLGCDSYRKSCLRAFD